MATDLGNNLPEELLAEIDQDQPRNNAVPLITVDSIGFPHVALISYFELFRKRRSLHFFVGSFSRTARNLDKRRVCTLIFAHRDFVYYIKARASRVRQSQPHVLYRLRVESVSEDFPTAEEGEVFLSSGIRFKASEEELQVRLKLRRSFESLVK